MSAIYYSKAELKLQIQIQIQIQIEIQKQIQKIKYTIFTSSIYSNIKVRTQSEMHTIDKVA